MPILTGIFAIGFAFIHLLVGKLHFLDVVPRSRWLSFAGGVAVSYIFLHVLPELSAHQSTFAEALELSGEAAETWVYLVSLLGLSIFYALERLARTSRSRRREDCGEDKVESYVFWLHIASFAVYNALIAYLLLHREESGLRPLTMYFLAMCLHFITNDFGLRQDQKDLYDRTGRWIIASAVALGWALGAATTIPDLYVGFLFAFLAGAVVLNVLKEELPEERKSRFWPFALGAGGYALLLVTVG